MTDAGAALTARAVVRHLPPSRAGRRPVVVGITGAVGIGKTTVAGALARVLGDDGRSTSVIGTDAFLRSNADLAAEGLAARKGFPESFDGALMADVLRGIRSGITEVAIPVYSHDIYDIVPGSQRRVAVGDVVVVEGVNALAEGVREHLDAGVYLDAPDDLVRRWFVERFVDFVAAARTNAESFYRSFVDLEPDAVEGLACATWDGINAPNLRDHIAPTRAHATVVVTFGEGRRIRSVTPVR